MGEISPDLFLELPPDNYLNADKIGKTIRGFSICLEIYFTVFIMYPSDIQETEHIEELYEPW